MHGEKLSQQKWETVIFLLSSDIHKNLVGDFSKIILNSIRLSNFFMNFIFILDLDSFVLFFVCFQDLSTKIVFRKFQDHIKVDPGLAILPIIAILCGVAIGLGTVALGLVLMIRGRHGAMSSDDRGDMSSDDDGNMKR